jgi:restriction modification system DNA specificity domain protein
MLDAVTKRRIDDARDILVGKIPDPKSQVEQITIALIYKFMDDMDAESEELGGEAKFFSGEYQKYSWRRVFNKTRGGQEILLDYREALQKLSENPTLPQIFHTIFRQAYLPYNDPETLKSFLKIIDQFEYDHSERLGDAFEYLLSVLGSQGDAGQFRTPRHIIDFMVDIVEPKIGETILDPACGTAGFLISAYKYILHHNSSEGKSNGDLLTPDQRKQLAQNICGYDISPDMVRLSLVNMYLHRITEPRIAEYDTLTSDAKWNEYFDVILANPPFMSPKGGIKPHARFSIQSKRSEALFVDYIIEHLTKTGRGAVIVPEGVIFKTDSAFVKLRKMLINDNYLYGVISLPQGVFNPYSGVKTSILLFDKVIAKLTDKILFAKVENDGFSLGAQRRPIEGSQLESIASAIKDFRTKIHRNEEYKRNNIALVDKAKIINTVDCSLNSSIYIGIKKNNTTYKTVKLSDIATITSGNAAPQDSSLFGGVYPFFRTSDVGAVHRSNNLIMSQDYLNDEGIKNLNLFPKGTILFPKSGASTFLNHRAVLGIDGYVSSHLAAIIPNTNRVNELYLYYLLTSIDAKDLTIDQAYPSLKLSQISSIRIPLPSIDVQKSIVSELDSYQKIIDAAKTIVDNYKPQIDLDPSWPMVDLGEIIKLSSGNGLTSRQIVQGDYPVYGGNGLIGLHNQYFVENPTIVIGRVGAYCGSIHITQPKSWITDNGLYVVNIKRPVLLEYLAIMLKDLNLHQYAKIGGQPSISQSVVYDKQIPLPDINIQKEIVSQLNKEQKYIDNAKELINVFTEKMNKRIAKIWNE